MPSTATTSLNHNQHPSTHTIPPTAMPLVSPPALLAAHLQQPTPTRPSQRSPSTPQRIDLNTSSLTHTHGSSVAKIGATTIVCGIRAELLPISDIPTYSSTSNDDPIATYHLVVPNLELSTGCSPFHSANTPPTSQAQSLTQRLYSLLLGSHVVSAPDLAITYTSSESESVPIQTAIERDIDILPDQGNRNNDEIKAYWVLYVDLVCLSYGGGSSVFDASWLAVYAALRDTVLPRAWWDADLGMVVCDERRENGRRLKVQGMPVALGFAVFSSEEKSWVLIDPDAFEEQCCAELGCVVVDCSGKERSKILRVEKSGGGFVGVAEMKEIIGYAEARWREWESVLEGVLGAKGG